MNQPQAATPSANSSMPSTCEPCWQQSCARPGSNSIPSLYDIFEVNPSERPKNLESERDGEVIFRQPLPGLKIHFQYFLVGVVQQKPRVGSCPESYRKNA